MDKQPDVWTSQGLLKHIKTLHADREDRRLVFILGAGASVTSGIPVGVQLVNRWLHELHERHCHGAEPLEEWATAANLDIHGFDYHRRAEFYPLVFERRFRRDPSEGYEALEKIMEQAKPSFGYSVLAQIMATKRHNVVVTTNFDNLLADAMATYSGRHPLMVGHESLSGYARTRLGRPLVAKIHRDLFLDPINDHGGTSELAEGWKSALTELFKHHTPIVIGYGGNDGSLMGFLQSLPANHIPGGLFWTYRKADGLPTGRIAEVVSHHRGAMVPIIGFDEFMLQLREIFYLDDLTEHIRNQADDHLKRYKEQTDALFKSLEAASHAPKQDQAEQSAVRDAASSLAKQQQSWWQWELKARGETDPEIRYALYQAGMRQFPDSPELVGNFATFVDDVRKDYDEAEQLYQRALELDPDDADYTGNFANFMKNVRKDYDEAERLYRRALELDPNRANHTGNFAIFMENVRKDYDEAERLYRRSLELDPNHANNTGNFAVFMADVRKDYDEAERFYRRALELDPEHALHTGNFALFMADVRKDYDEAERLYRRALELDPDDAHHTGNFALFMKNVRKDYDEAERLYRRALELDPDDAHHTGNFAGFMAEVRKDYDEAERLYQRALELDPNDANHTGNFAELLLLKDKAADAISMASTAIHLDARNGYTGSGPYVFILALAGERSGLVVTPVLSVLKGLLIAGNSMPKWSFFALLEWAGQNLGIQTVEFYQALADAIQDNSLVSALDRFPRWAGLQPTSVEALANWPTE